MPLNRTTPGFGNSTGGLNTYLGYYAGYVGNGSGVRNVFIGYNAGVNLTSTVVSNAVAIGANAIVTQSNSIVLGGTGSDAVKVGIGNTAPGNKLEITQGVANQSGLRFTNLTSASPASVLNQYKFLTVNASGDVVLGSLNSSARIGVESQLWQVKGEQIQTTNAGGVLIGQGINKTPAGYRLYVEEGILTEKIKVAVKNTEHWSDRVFKASYKLQSLKNVAQYIRQHQHLPGIPSAKQMVEQGNDLHLTDTKLLEKIEELTLYVIGLKEDNEMLKQEVATVRRENKAIKHTLRATSLLPVRR